MRMSGKGMYVGQEEKTSKTSGHKYIIVRILDDAGKTFEMISEKNVMIERLRNVEFIVNVTQGKFSKYELESMKAI